MKGVAAINDCRLIYSMNTLTKKQYNSIVAQVAEFGTGIIHVPGKQPPWIVRKVGDFIYVTERVREYIVCTVLVPEILLENKIENYELEKALRERNDGEEGKYGYHLIHIADISLIALSAYYFHNNFDVHRDIPSLEQHALHVLNEL